MRDEIGASGRLTPTAAHGFTPAMNPVLTRRRSPAWTLANCLTYGRLVAVPVVVALLYWPTEPGARFGALAVYILAAITDYLDGYVARTYDQSSALGRMLDPIADKIMVAAVIVMLIHNNQIIGWHVIPALVIILSFQLVGEVASRALALPLPGPVVGLVLLLARAPAVLPARSASPARLSKVRKTSSASRPRKWVASLATLSRAPRTRWAT